MNPNNQIPQPSQQQLPPQVSQMFGNMGGGQQAQPAGQPPRIMGAPPQGDVQFGAGHNAVYEKLRTLLMNLHAQGVPGLDNVLNALNKEHVNQLKQSTQPQLGRAAVAGQSASMSRPMQLQIPQQNQNIPQDVQQGINSAIGTAARVLPQLPQSTLDAFPMIAPMMSMPSYGQQVQQGMGQQKG